MLNFKAISNFDEILQEADGIMYVRDFIGLDLPIEYVIFVNYELILTIRHLWGKLKLLINAISNWNL